MFGKKKKKNPYRFLKFDHGNSTFVYDLDTFVSIEFVIGKDVGSVNARTFAGSFNMLTCGVMDTLFNVIQIHYEHYIEFEENNA